MARTSPLRESRTPSLRQVATQQTPHTFLYECDTSSLAIVVCCWSFTVFPASIYGAGGGRVGVKVGCPGKEVHLLLTTVACREPMTIAQHRAGVKSSLVAALRLFCNAFTTQRHQQRIPQHDSTTNLETPPLPLLYELQTASRFTLHTLQDPHTAATATQALK